MTSATSSVGSPQYRIASVDNALRLLLMLRDRSEIRLSVAADEPGVANSTAHRLLAMLAYHGFVRQNPATKGYAAGPTLHEVGLAVVERMDVREFVRPLLEEIAAHTGETVHFGVLEGAEVRYLDAVESPHPGRGGILYVSAKFALRGAVLSLASELAPEIRVNAVAPGGTGGTDLRGLRSLGQYGRSLGSDPDRVESIRSRSPLDVALDGGDIAASYVFLASDAARGMTGRFLHPDGGAQFADRPDGHR